MPTPSTITSTDSVGDVGAEVTEVPKVNRSRLDDEELVCPSGHRAEVVYRPPGK